MNRIEITSDKNKENIFFLIEPDMIVTKRKELLS